MMGNQLPYLTFPNYENVKTRFQKKIENDFSNKLFDLYIEWEIATIFIIESIINKF